jgi:hypothetical protein
MVSDSDGLLSAVSSVRTDLAPEMSGTHRLLWTVILAATVGDVVLTIAGLSAGLREGNLFLRVMLAEFGLFGLWLVKFGAMLWLVAGWQFLSERNATVFLALFAVVTVAIVAHNSLLLL